jgi:allantoate deiminase
MARLTDVAMMFVRCRGGISHNPAEYCESADAEVALGVLLAALERLSA